MGLIMDYARSLAVFMVFSAFVGLVIPSGSFKKYIILVLNIMLISLVLRPIKDITESPPAFKLDTAFEEGDNREAVISEYERIINNRTASLIYEKTGLEVISTEVVMAEGEIADIFAVAALPASEISRGKLLALGNAAKPADKDEIKKAVSENIKNCLRDFYKLGEGNIHITVQDK